MSATSPLYVVHFNQLLLTNTTGTYAIRGSDATYSSDPTSTKASNRQSPNGVRPKVELPSIRVEQAKVETKQPIRGAAVRSHGLVV